MPKLPSREVLEAMKRTDLQRLCKDYGVKANLKSEALIDMLLDSEQPPAVKPPPAPAPRAVSTRIASRAGARLRDHSGGSVIIHDSDDESDSELETRDSDQPDPTPVPAPPPRTRKAKETQTRLGVGRPVIAGGSGARAITRSGTVSRGKRGRPSKNTIQTQATIIEEEAVAEQPVKVEAVKDSASTDETGANHAVTSVNSTFASLQDVDKHVADALRPLHEEIQSFKSGLEQMQALNAEIERLRLQMNDMDSLQHKVEQLTEEVETLRSQAALVTTLEAEMRLLKEANNASEATGRRSLSPVRQASRSGNFNFIFGAPTDITSSMSGSQTIGMSSSNSNPNPGIAPSALGKRRRGSETSNVTGVFEEGQESEFTEGELATKVVRPTKKRTKISQDAQDLDMSPGDLADVDEDIHPPAPRIPSFTVFTGPDQQSDHVDPPPPTTHLSDLFALSPPPQDSSTFRHGATTSTAHAAENQHPFAFSFHPPSSTPAGPLYPMSMPSFPYPEPQSPSPAGPRTSASVGHRPISRQGMRTDIFQSLGLPPPSSRSRSREPLSTASGSGSEAEHGVMGAFVDPAALTQRSSDRDTGMSSNSAVLPAAPGAGPPLKRTMYGTELDSDTRFGDFGMDGVATGFWAGGRQ